MASLFRRFSAGVALIAFLAGLGLGTLTPGHFGADDDAACGQVAVAAAHPSIQFEAVRPGPPAGHCAFCHWQRVVGVADLAALSSWSVTLEPAHRVLPTGVDAPRSLASDNHLSRGPPSLRA